MSSTWQQVRALLWLRWRMVRSSTARAGFLILAVMGVSLLVAAAAGARTAPRTLAPDTALLLPSALLGFAILAVVAPLMAGGGYELYPEEQLVGYPVRPATRFFASVIQAPLNLAWMTQVVLLVAASSFATVSSVRLSWALPLLALYVAAVTVFGQTVAWLVVGARQVRVGRIGVWVAGALAALATVAIFLTGRVTDIVRAAPTRPVVDAMAGHSGGRVAGVAVWLAVGSVLTAWLGIRLVAWAARRPTRDRDVRRAATSVRRRPPRPSAYRELLATDRASVWRSTALRRGAIVTGLLPGVLAAVAGVDWFTVTVIAGLVASGAGLLFGVNMFSLDAQGAIWLASTPLEPRLQMRAKLQAAAEVCLVTSSLSAVLAAVRADPRPTSTQIVCLVAAIISCSAAVVSICSDLSVSKPHRADLRGARDTPAPPGAMVGYSVRLATVSTLLGMMFGAVAMTNAWWIAAVLAAAVTVLAAASVARDLRKYAQATPRALVVSRVANG